MDSTFEKIHEQVCKIPFIDTHEHLIDENEGLDCIKPYIHRELITENDAIGIANKILRENAKTIYAI